MKALLCILGLFFISIVVAQDARLFQQEWYLHDLVIDGESNVPPVNSELHHVLLEFIEPNFFLTRVCDGTGGGDFLLFNGMTEFSFEFGIGWLAGSCNIYENEMYTYLYQGFWNDTQLDPYHYKITEDGSNLILIVIASNENIAIYRTDFLAIEEFEDSVFQIYPNPVEDQLYLLLSTNLNVKNIRVYDIQGRLIRQEIPGQTDDLIEIETANLPSGLYFVEVIDDTGGSSIERFVKN